MNYRVQTGNPLSLETGVLVDLGAVLHHPHSRIPPSLPPSFPNTCFEPQLINSAPTEVSFQPQWAIAKYPSSIQVHSSLPWSLSHWVLHYVALCDFAKVIKVLPQFFCRDTGGERGAKIIEYLILSTGYMPVITPPLMVFIHLKLDPHYVRMQRTVWGNVIMTTRYFHHILDLPEGLSC